MPKKFPLFFIILTCLIGCVADNNKTEEVSGDPMTMTLKETQVPLATSKATQSTSNPGRAAVSTPVPSPTSTVTPSPVPTVAPTASPAPTVTPSPAPTLSINMSSPSNRIPTTTVVPEPTSASINEPTIRWNFMNESQSWESNSNPPECGDIDDLFTVFPVDINNVTQFARPGRLGTGNYDDAVYIAHSALRTDNSSHADQPIKFPAKGFSLASAAQRFESRYSDLVQIKLEFIHPCGLQVRLDHLNSLTGRWSEILRDLPLNEDSNSRITFFPQGVHLVGEGELLSYGIGHPTNVYLDFGVYDLRSKNNIHEYIANEWPDYVGQGDYGICWAGFFGDEIESALHALPAGANPDSDYCDTG